MIATKKNPRTRAFPGGRRRPASRAALSTAGRSPVGAGRPGGLSGAILTEVNCRGVPASCPGTPLVSAPEGGPPAVPRPIVVGRRSGAEAIVVVIDGALVEFLFGAGGHGNPRPLLRSLRARSYENRLCAAVTATATALDARRLLILCVAERASTAERASAIRWVREVAHRIGYECAVNGLHNLGTSYLVLVTDAAAGAVAQSVVDWYRTGRVR